MKKVYPDRIVNIPGTDLFDNIFSIDILDWGGKEKQYSDVEVVFISDLLEKRKNIEILKMTDQKPAMYSNVYSPEDELEIFKGLFENAIKNKKRIHIVGVTLKEEVEILEEYYEELRFLREDINCFAPDFSVPLVTVSVKIENLMWKGSDYKAMRSKIFFQPPIRESGQVKAMFKGINRGVTAGIYIEKHSSEIEEFLSDCVKNEKILPITLAKTLKYNLEQAGFNGEDRELTINY
ncbi:hypothetical protein A9Q91_05660 [Candidatus Gracilibacteria bacterium 28_42_T64]|nr:hypothetical protein A9Q91_05660 [Candidatus Gracilibacteria bacterium 28_42_T64]